MGDKKYRLVFESLKADVLKGKYRADQNVPSVRALMRKFKVSSATVQHAFDVLKEQGIVVGRQGSGTVVTKSGAGRKLGVIVPLHAYSELFLKIVSELSRLSQEAGYMLVLGDVSSARASVRKSAALKLAARFVEAGVAGVVYMPIDFVSDAERVNRDVLGVFDRAGIAVALCDYDIVSPPRRSTYDIVGINNVEAGVAMAEHLFSAGARRLSFLLHPDSPLSHVNRYRGALIAEKGGAGRLAVRKLVADPEDAKAVARHLRSFRPDAFVCGNDALAMRFAKTLRKLNVSVPRDVMLAGFDGVQLGAMMTPPLTTVVQPCVRMAEMVFHMLRSRIANPLLPPRETFLPFELSVTESTARKKHSGK